MAPINEVTYNNVLATLVADQGVSTPINEVTYNSCCSRKILIRGVSTPINEVTCNSVALVIGVVGVNSKNK